MVDRMTHSHVYEPGRLLLMSTCVDREMPCIGVRICVCVCLYLCAFGSETERKREREEKGGREDY